MANLLSIPVQCTASPRSSSAINSCRAANNIFFLTIQWSFSQSNCLIYKMSANSKKKKTIISFQWLSVKSPKPIAILVCYHYIHIWDAWTWDFFGHLCLKDKWNDLSITTKLPIIFSRNWLTSQPNISALNSPFYAF